MQHAAVVRVADRADAGRIQCCPGSGGARWIRIRHTRRGRLRPGRNRRAGDHHRFDLAIGGARRLRGRHRIVLQPDDGARVAQEIREQAHRIAFLQVLGDALERGQQAAVVADQQVREVARETRERVLNRRQRRAEVVLQRRLHEIAGGLHEVGDDRDQARAVAGRRCGRRVRGSYGRRQRRTVGRIVANAADVNQPSGAMQEVRFLTARRNLPARALVRILPRARRHVANRRRRRAETEAIVADLVVPGLVPVHQRRAGGVVRIGVIQRFDAEELDRVRVALGRHARAVHARADRARHDIGAPHRDLMVAEGRVQQHFVVRALERRVIGDVVGVAVVLGAVPQHLDQREQGVAVQLVLIRQIDRHREDVEIHAAREQRGVVHAQHAQRTAVDVLGRRDHHAAVDAALAVAVVVDLAVVEHRLATDAERLVRSETLRVAQQARQEQLVQHALLRAVRHRREIGHVHGHGQHVGQIARGEAEPVGGAEHHVVFFAEAPQLLLADLAVVAEQAVAVQRRPRRFQVGRGGARKRLAGQRGFGDAAGEGRGQFAAAIRQAVAVNAALRIRRVWRIGRVIEQPVRRTAHFDGGEQRAALDLRLQLRRQPVDQLAQRGLPVGGRRIGRYHVARHRERALDFTCLLGVRVLDDLGHLEARRAAEGADAAVGIFFLAEVADEGVVAHVAQTADVVVGAGDGEIPGEVQRCVAHDARIGEHREHAGFELRAAALHLRQLRCDLVAAGAERRLRGNRSAALSLQLAQHDDITAPFLEVNRRPDDERRAHQARARHHGIGLAEFAAGHSQQGRSGEIDLGPDRMPLAGCRVDHKDRRIGIVVLRQIRDRHCALDASVVFDCDAGHVGHDHLARREAVVAVPLGRVDRLAGGVARHGQRIEIDALPGSALRRRLRAARGRGHRKVIAREREQAVRRIQQVAAARLRFERGARQRRVELGRRVGSAGTEHAAGVFRQSALHADVVERCFRIEQRAELLGAATRAALAGVSALDVINALADVVEDAGFGQRVLAGGDGRRQILRAILVEQAVVAFDAQQRRG